ncbi:putative permease of the major facilitator superfamily [Oenococcus oeni]|uniref:hypothetical protein n=1 Tax=Oenococcus oeni TaxID=1247 RepID=UPI0010BB8EA8|nr:hypothetical protein [Oenococcus oeni]SYV99155.1 putative permease of the major facilitator superfamily [Oenococcus oeni]
MTDAMIIWILIAVYGVLMLLTSLSKAAVPLTKFFGFLGSFALIFATVIGIFHRGKLFAFILTLIGFVFVSTGAFIQGRQTTFHWLHHFVRGIMEVAVLVLLFIFLKL